MAQAQATVGSHGGEKMIIFPASTTELVFLVVHQHREQRGVREGRERGGCGAHDGCTIKRAHQLQTAATPSSLLCFKTPV